MDEKTKAVVDERGVFDTKKADEHFPGFIPFGYDAEEAVPQHTLKVFFKDPEHARDLVKLLEESLDKTNIISGVVTEVSIPGIFNAGTKKLLKEYIDLANAARDFKHRPGYRLVPMRPRDLQQIVQGDVTVHAANCALSALEDRPWPEVDDDFEPPVTEDRTVNARYADEEPEDLAFTEVVAMGQELLLLVEKLRTFNELLVQVAKKRKKRNR